MDSLLNSAWFSDFIHVVVIVITTLTTIILAPISAIIATFLPPLNDVMLTVASFFVYATQYAGFVIDALAIPKTVLFMVVTYYTFIVGSSLAVVGVKVALKWYRMLKP